MGKIYLVIMTLLTGGEDIDPGIQVIEFGDLETCLTIEAVIYATHLHLADKFGRATYLHVESLCVDPEWLYANRSEDFRNLFTDGLHSYDPSWKSWDNEGPYADRPRRHIGADE